MIRKLFHLFLALAVLVASVVPAHALGRSVVKSKTVFRNRGAVGAAVIAPPVVGASFFVPQRSVFVQRGFAPSFIQRTPVFYGGVQQAPVFAPAYGGCGGGVQQQLITPPVQSQSFQSFSSQSSFFQQ